MAVRILLADDNKTLRSKVRTLLESRPDWQVVAEAGTGREAVQKAAQLKPDVVVLDYSMPELDGISAIPLIRGAVPGAEIVFLTVHDARFTVGRAIQAGTCAYVVKIDMAQDLMPAVEAASQHRTFFRLIDQRDGRTTGRRPPIDYSSR